MTSAISVTRLALYGLDRIAFAMAYVAGAVLLLASFYITADVIGRRFFHMSSKVTDEFGGYALLVGGMWALAFALTTGAHVRIDVLMPYLPAWARSVLDYAALASMTVFAAILAFYSWRLAIESFTTDARAMSFLRTPLFLPQGLLSIGFTLLAVHGAVIFLLGTLESAREGRLAPFQVLRVAAKLTEGL